MAELGSSDEVSQKDVYKKEQEIDQKVGILVNIGKWLLGVVSGGLTVGLITVGITINRIDNLEALVAKHQEDDKIHRDYGEIPNIYMRQDLSLVRYNNIKNELSTMSAQFNNTLNQMNNYIESQFNDVKAAIRENHK